MTARPRHRRLPWWRRERTQVAAVTLTVVGLFTVSAAWTLGDRFSVTTPDGYATPTSSPRPSSTFTIAWPTPSMPSIGAEGAWDPTTETPDAPVIATKAPLTALQPADDHMDRGAQNGTEGDAPAVSAAEPVEAAPAPTLLTLVNDSRADNGCPPVTEAPDLMAAAQQWSQQQAADDAMSHSDGPAGYGTWAENVAVGYETPAAVHAAFMASPRHAANVLDCDYTLIGYGSTDGASRYWTEMFAK